MASKVFISWSGDLSKKLAEEIRLWLPAVLQFVKPYFTPNDIEKGTRWSSEITNELESSNAGIICLTKDNINKPWILFEAGALSKNFGKANVCTILFNLDNADLTGPLTSFQATRFDRADFKKFLITINNTGGDAKLDIAVLNDVFEMWWPKLETKINGILKSHVESSPNAIRSEREILEEVLELTRINTKRFPRRNDISRMAIRRLLDMLMEMQYRLVKYSGKESMIYFDEMRISIKELCMEIDEPELYERFVMSAEKGSFYWKEKQFLENVEKENDKK
ncbi:MAG: toll/interleukin-1 receptor domain-containing protein [Chitinophagaceae bacterium]